MVAGRAAGFGDDLAAVLRGHHRTVVALDVPGCGEKRGRDLAALDLDGVVTELLADIRATGHSDIVLVGHSLAGALMPRMAERAPDLVKRLICLTCSAPPAGTSYAALIGSSLHGERDDAVGWPVDRADHGLDERNRIMFCTDMTEDAVDAFLGRLGQDDWPIDVVLRTDWRYDHLAAIPSSYILCERDGILPPAWQETVCGTLPCGSNCQDQCGAPGDEHTA